MFKYFKMKAIEIKLKLAFYTVVEKVLNENKDYLKLANNLFLTLKDTPLDELRDTFIKSLAGFIHDEVTLEHEGTNSKRM